MEKFIGWTTVILAGIFTLAFMAVPGLVMFSAPAHFADGQYVGLLMVSLYAFPIVAVTGGGLMLNQKFLLSGIANLFAGIGMFMAWFGPVGFLLGPLFLLAGGVALLGHFKGNVKNVQPAHQLTERPRQVIYAVLLLWISIVISIPQLYGEYQRAPDTSELVLFLIFVVIVLAISITLNIYVWRGRNWARIVLLVLAVGSLIVFLVSVTETLKNPVIEIVLNVVALVIEAIAVYLLFTRPGSLWFHRGR